MTTERELISHMVAVITDAHDECLDGMHTSAMERLMDLIREGNAYLQQAAPVAPADRKAARVHELVNAGPFPGMSEAFDGFIGSAAWTDPAWRSESSVWAAAWRAAKAAPVAPAEPMSDAALRTLLINAALQIASDKGVPVDPTQPDKDQLAVAMWAVRAYEKAAPVAHALVPLTDEQIRRLDWCADIGGHDDVVEIVRATEAAHGIKP